MGSLGPRLVIFGGVCCLLLAACGSAALPSARPEKMVTRAQIRALPVLTAPLTACRVLAFTHAAAQEAEPKVAFVGLSGSRITAQGVPRPEGDWQATYVGTLPVKKVPESGLSPTQPRFRHVTVTVTGQGHSHVQVNELAGMPLGQAFFDAPMPTVDSHMVLERARVLRPSQPLDAEVRLVLTGLLGSHHFHELVWKVHAATQVGFERPLVFNATTGAPVSR